MNGTASFQRFMVSPGFRVVQRIDPAARAAARVTNLVRRASNRDYHEVARVVDPNAKMFVRTRKEYARWSGCGLPRARIRHRKHTRPRFKSKKQAILPVLATATGTEPDRLGGLVETPADADNHARGGPSDAVVPLVTSSCRGRRPLRPVRFSATSLPPGRPPPTDPLRKAAQSSTLCPHGYPRRH